MSDLKNTLKGSGKEAQPGEHSHPDEALSLENALEILKQSETGLKLAKLVENPGLKLHLIKAPQETSYLPETKEIFIGIPANRDVSIARITLLLASALREAEQELMGVKRPGLDAPVEEHFGVGMAKFSDKIAYMCQVAVELNDLESFIRYDFIDEIRKMGHAEVIEMFMGVHE